MSISQMLIVFAVTNKSILNDLNFIKLLDNLKISTLEPYSFSYIFFIATIKHTVFII